MRERLGLVALAVALSVTTSTPGWADTSKECIDAHAAGQRFHKDKRLREARSQYTECAAERCPEMVQKECIALLRDVSKLVPSVVFAATDAEGNDLSEVKVEMDGKPLVDRLDGHAVELEPGKHTFRFRCKDGGVSEKAVVVREGERARKISVELAAGVPPPRAAGGKKAAPAATSEDGESKEVHKAVAYVLGVVGIMALGGFAYGALSGKSHLDDLEESCAPNCTEGDVDIPRQEYLLADISLAVAAVSLGAGVYLYFHYEPGTEQGSATAPAPRAAAGLRGLTLGYTGRF